MASAKLTAVIPTLNEEKDLPETLRSVKGLADEILIVDSGSTDKTIEIAKEFGAKVANHPFKSFSDTRNFGNEQATGDWILFPVSILYGANQYGILTGVPKTTHTSGFTKRGAGSGKAWFTRNTKPVDRLVNSKTILFIKITKRSLSS